MKGLYSRLANKSAITGLTITIAEIVMLTAVLLIVGLYASNSEADVITNFATVAINS